MGEGRGCVWGVWLGGGVHSRVYVSVWFGWVASGGPGGLSRGLCLSMVPGGVGWGGGCYARMKSQIRYTFAVWLKTGLV